MPSTQPYTPTFDFENDPAPQDKVDAAALQNQLALISANLTDLIAALAIAIRDDNTLSDDLVRLRNLHPEIETLLNQLAAGEQAVAALAYKLPALVATTGSITLSGEQTIDGVLTSSSRVLVKNQSTASENGIYVSAAGAWSRAVDLPAGAASGSGWGIMVQQGTANANTAWMLLAGDTGVTVGTDTVTFAGPTLQSVNPAVRYRETITFDNGALTQDITHNLGASAVAAALSAVSGTPVLQGVQASQLSADVMRLIFPTQPGTVSVTVNIVA